MIQIMDLSFIILNYKAKDLTQKAIRSILDLRLPLQYEIVIVDNASGDGVETMLQKEFLTQKGLNISFIPLPKNVGYSAANNIGIKRSRGKYILIMNPDIIYSDVHDIMDMYNYAHQHEDVGIIGPRLYNLDGSVQNSCFRFYHLLTPLYRRTCFGKLPWAKKEIARYLMLDFDHNRVREVDWILGSNMFIRRSILQTIGMFDEKFFLYFSDLELCFRAWESRIKVIYYPQTHVTHYHRRESAVNTGFKTVLSYITKIHIKDWIIFLLKYKNRRPKFGPME